MIHQLILMSIKKKKKQNSSGGTLTSIFDYLYLDKILVLHGIRPLPISLTHRLFYCQLCTTRQDLALIRCVRITIKAKKKGI
jgi:hypothetical protein